MIVTLFDPHSSQKWENIIMVSLTTADGAVGLMDGHENLMAKLSPCLITLHSQNGNTLFFFSSGGIVNMRSGKCSLISSEFYDEAKIRNADFSSHPFFKLLETIKSRIFA